MSACGVCGAAAQAPFRPPAPELAPDLDMRPGEPTRSTMDEWLRICSGCGAAAPDLAALRRDAAEIVRSPAYRAMDALPEPARPFVRWAMLCPPNERHEALLQAAWVADDIPDEAAARDLRRQAADAWGDPADIESALRLVDVLRRSGDFDRAGQLAADLQTNPMDENSARILAFQRARLASGDSGRHLLSSALRPPARMPHVAHGKPKRAGFWGRLLGG
jgi:hypothetical protein